MTRYYVKYYLNDNATNIRVDISEACHLNTKTDSIKLNVNKDNMTLIDNSLVFYFYTDKLITQLDALDILFDFTRNELNERLKRNNNDGLCLYTRLRMIVVNSIDKYLDENFNKHNNCKIYKIYEFNAMFHSLHIHDKWYRIKIEETSFNLPSLSKDDIKKLIKLKLVLRSSYNTYMIDYRNIPYDIKIKIFNNSKEVISND